MGGGPSLLRRPAFEKSNAELTSSLRANILAYQHAAVSESHEPSSPPETAPKTSQHSNGSSTPPNPLPALPTWTHREAASSTLFVPSPPPPTGATLAEPRQAYDITAKLFFLPTTPVELRGAYAREAISLVLRELGVPSIDLLIISFPGFSFDAEDDDDEEEVEEEEEEDEGAPDAAQEGAENGTVSETISNGAVGDSRPEDQDVLSVYRDIVTSLHSNPSFAGEPIVSRLGVAEFGAHRLSRFLHALSTSKAPGNGSGASLAKPSVDQLNVRDCCVVPRTLIQLARREGVELLTHNDCTDVLPPGTVREILGPVKSGGVGLLCSSEARGRKRKGGEGEDGEEECGGLRGEVLPRFVVKYTAVVADRGVVENKGYFAVAELVED